MRAASASSDTALTECPSAARDAPRVRRTRYGLLAHCCCSLSSSSSPARSAGRRRRRSVYWGGGPWIGGGWGGGWGGVAGSVVAGWLRWLRWRRWIQRRRRRRQILMLRRGRAGRHAVSERRRRGARATGTARCCTGRPRAATTCPGTPTSISCWSRTRSRPRGCGPWGPRFVAWRKSGPEPPLLITRAEWNRATDAFPVEITDMRAAYQVLRGADPLAGSRGLAAPTCARRSKREFRGKLLRLRQGYAASAGDPAALGALAARRASATMLVLLRGLLTLLGRTVPQRPTPARRGGRRGARRGERAAPACRSSPGEAQVALPARSTSSRTWTSAARAAQFLDQLQLGDR